MSDSIYCRSALIYSNFRIRWKVSWLIWSVLVMWTSLSECCALFHNTRWSNVQNERHAFLSHFVVLRVLHGNSTNCQRDPHTPISFGWSSSINACYGFWQIICALLLLLFFRACVFVIVACSDFLLVCYKYSMKKFRCIFGSHLNTIPYSTS